MLSSSSLSSFFFFSLLLSLLPPPSHCSQSSSAAFPGGSNSSVYEILPEYGLPPGLLPDTVVSFSLFPDGRFAVDLAGECYVEFDYLVYYQPQITGLLRYGGVEDLKGIQVRSFLLWFDVDTIKVDLPPNDSIYFEVGWLTRKLAVAQFETVHSCRAEKMAADRLGSCGGVAVGDLLFDA